MGQQVDGLLSVVVPVYKVEKYLDRCVESIVNQTYRNLEIILVDDGSPDSCGEMCDGWAEKDSRIRVIHKPNGGLSDARNAGIAAATGDYLAFVDSDDYVGIKMYETMINAMERTGAGMACCGMFIIEKEKEIAVRCMEKETLFSGKEAIRELLLGGYVGEEVWDKVYKKDLFRDIRFPVGEINEDIVVQPRLLDEAERVVHVGVPFSYYCQNGESITRSGYSDTKRIFLKHLEDTEAYLKENHPELLRYFDALQGRYCQSNLYLLLANKEVRKTFQDDYKAFYRRFRKSFKKMMRLVPYGGAEKLKGYLIYYRLYYHLHWLKQRMKK